MDKFNPTQNVVNPTYSSTEEAPKEIQQQIEQVEKDVSAEDNKIEEVKKEEVLEKMVIETKSTSVTQLNFSDPTNTPITNPQLTFDNRMMQNTIQVNNPIMNNISAVQNKIEATKIQTINTNVINPQLNLRMVSPMPNFGSQGYLNMMNPSLNMNIQSGVQIPNQMNQMQPSPSPSHSNQYGHYQMNQQAMNPNLVMGQPSQMPFNYSNIRQPINPMTMNPQINQIYNQNMAMMNKNMMTYNQMATSMGGQTHYNYNQMTQFQNQQQHQHNNQIMQMNTYGQNMTNSNPSLNMDYNRMNQQQTMTTMQNMQVEERKNVITPTSQNNQNTGSNTNNTKILSNILQVLQNPDVKQMLGKLNQPQSQGSVDDKSKDPRIRKKK
jgi:hypothetical protein